MHIWLTVTRSTVYSLGDVEAHSGNCWKSPVGEGKDNGGENNYTTTLPVIINSRFAYFCFQMPATFSQFSADPLRCRISAAPQHLHYYECCPASRLILKKTSLMKGSRGCEEKLWICLEWQLNNPAVRQDNHWTLLHVYMESQGPCLCLSHCNSKSKSSCTRNMLRQRGEMVIRLVSPKLYARQMAIICDYVTLVRPLLFLINHGGFDGQWWSAGKQRLADSALSRASDLPEKESKVIGFNKIVQQLIIL